MSKNTPPQIGAIVMASIRIDRQLIGQPTFHFPAIVTDVLPTGQVAMVVFVGPLAQAWAAENLSTPTQRFELATLLPWVAESYDKLPLPGTWRHLFEHKVGGASMDGRPLVASIGKPAAPKHNGHELMPPPPPKRGLSLVGANGEPADFGDLEPVEASESTPIRPDRDPTPPDRVVDPFELPDDDDQVA